jgi:hypothetical protein
MTPELRVHQIGNDWEDNHQPEFGFLVAGTVDPDEATPFLAGWISVGQDPVLTEKEAYERVAALEVIPGLYRWNPCHPSSCFEDGPHRPGHMDRVNVRGRGVFPAVYFQQR